MLSQTARQGIVGAQLQPLSACKVKLLAEGSSKVTETRIEPPIFSDYKADALSSRPLRLDNEDYAQMFAAGKLSLNAVIIKLLRPVCSPFYHFD